MRIAETKPLFAWDCIEDNPSLGTLREFLASVPDARLLEGLRGYRGRGRDDYPVHVLWGTVLLTIALRHVTVEACLGELGRNAALRRLVGIETESGVPKKWNISRFLRVLGSEPHLSLLREVFDGMAKRLGAVVPDLGRDTAGDATWLSGRLPRSGEETDCDLPEAAGGRKEYKDGDGKVTRVVEWFGYKFHVLVDKKHEVALAYRVSSTKIADNEELPGLVEEAEGNLPARRMKTLAYDKAADDEKVHGLLDAKRIAPVIENRSMWTDESERMLPGHDGTSNVVYDEAGTVYCYDKVSRRPVRHPMAYIGHEPERRTLT